jgi:hypothetical protein
MGQLVKGQNTLFGKNNKPGHKLANALVGC